MEQARKNKYSRGERVQSGNISYTPRPEPVPVKPYNSYGYCFAVQHVLGTSIASDPERKYIMVSGYPNYSDWAGKAKLPDGSTVWVETIDQLEYGPGIQYIVLRLNKKDNSLEIMAVQDYSKVPKNCMQRCLAVIDDDRVEQIFYGDAVDFTVEEEPFKAFAEEEGESES